MYIYIYISQILNPQDVAPRQMPYSFAVELQQSMGFVHGTHHVAPLLAVRDALAAQMWRFQWSDAAMTLGVPTDGG